MYDTATGLYYLQSRYYDPQCGRFLNPDDVSYLGASGTVLGWNLFTYCENDPVNKLDYTGNRPHRPNDKIINAQDIIIRNASNIKKWCKSFKVDPNVLAAIIYTEQVKNVNFWDNFDGLAASLGMDTSIGICQVRVTAAIKVEDKGYLPKTKETYSWIRRQGQRFRVVHSRFNIIATKLEDEETCIKYAAAYLALIQDMWKKEYPRIKYNVAVLATLYNIGENGSNGPHSNPQSNEFGRYAKTSYILASVLLNMR